MDTSVIEQQEAVEVEFTDTDYKNLSGFVKAYLGRIPFNQIHDVIGIMVQKALENGFDSTKGDLAAYLRGLGKGKGKGKNFWILQSACDKWKRKNGYRKLTVEETIKEKDPDDAQKTIKHKKWERVEFVFAEKTKVNDEGDIEYPDPADPSESVLDKLIRAEEGKSDEDMLCEREHELDAIELQYTFFMMKLQQYMRDLKNDKIYEELYCIRAMLGLGKQQDIKKLKGQKSKNATFWRDKVLTDLTALLKLEKLQVERMLKHIKKSWEVEEKIDEFDSTKTHNVRTNVYAEVLGLNKNFQPHLFLL